MLHGLKRQDVCEKEKIHFDIAAGGELKVDNRKTPLPSMFRAYVSKQKYHGYIFYAIVFYKMFKRTKLRTWYYE